MSKNSSMIKQLPNFLTTINIMLGCLAIVFAFEGNLQLSSVMVILAAVMDFFDGFFARILHAYSGFGKSLDSLADMVAFGIAPAIVLYHILIMSLTFHDSSFNIETASLLESIILYAAFLIAIFSGIRLARFTSTNTGNSHFLGVPTPANALLIASIAIILVETEKEQLRELLLNTYFLVILILILCILMVSGLKLFSLKFSTFSFKSNQVRYIFLIVSALLLILFQLFAVPVIFVFYIFLSLLQNWKVIPE